MHLTNILPPQTRATLYAAFAVTGLLLGAIQVGYAAADSGQPTALTVALAVYAFVGGALGFTAQANTPATAEIDTFYSETPVTEEELVVDEAPVLPAEEEDEDLNA